MVYIDHQLKLFINFKPNGMKQKLKNYLKFGILLIGVLSISRGCSNIEPFTNVNTNIKYQPIAANEAASFFNSSASKGLFNKTSNNLNLNIDVASLDLQPIENSSLSMPVFKATTKNTNIISEVFLVKVEDTILPFLFNRIPDESPQTQEFSGIISITALNGHFVNGYRVENGVFVSQFVRLASPSKSSATSKTMTDPEVDCDESLDPNSIFCDQQLSEVVITAPSTTTNTTTTLNFGPRGIDTTNWNISDPSTSYTGGGTDSSGGTSNVNVFPCDDPIHGCDHDYEQDKPCPGDPVPNPEIAPQTSSGLDGGLFGTCTRPGKICKGAPGVRPHDGVDIKNPYGEPVYAMYDGIAIPNTQFKNGKVDGAGYYIGITSQINGETVRLVYFHLQKDNRLSGSVKAGDIIGYQGDSGNLKAAIEQKLTESHVHIKAQLNGKTANPLDYLATTVDPITGQIKTPCK